MKIAVIGLGVVGRAQLRMLRKGGHKATGYDSMYPVPYPHREIAGCDAAIIAVGTPRTSFGGADLSALRAALAELPAGVPALIRSTVPPGTTDAVNAAGRLAAHWPEYLHERAGGPWSESLDVPFAVVGAPPEARSALAPVVRKLRGEAPGPVHECAAVTAELAKYTANLYWAARVTFVNEMAAVAAAHDGDWEAVREAWLCDERVSADYTSMEGFPPGFGGACWPKDLAALTASALEHGYAARFLADIAEANARFRDDEES